MTSDSAVSQGEEYAALKAVLAGDIDRYQLLVTRYKERAVRIAYGFLRNYADASDAAQDAFVKAYKNIHRFKFESSFYTWFYRILLNVCKDTVKKKKWTVSIHDHETRLKAESIAEASDALTASEQSDFIANYIHKLSFKQQSVIVLSYFEGMTAQEVAGMMKISEGTVKATKFQSLKKLRMLMEKK